MFFQTGMNYGKQKVLHHRLELYFFSFFSFFFFEKQRSEFKQNTLRLRRRTETIGARGANTNKISSNQNVSRTKVIILPASIAIQKLAH